MTFLSFVVGKTLEIAANPPKFGSTFQNSSRIILVELFNHIYIGLSSVETTFLLETINVLQVERCKIYWYAKHFPFTEHTWSPSLRDGEASNKIVISI